ncbi:hepatoma-derived growth factor-related protein 2-like [Eutrema salsugineum]|uniref:hepatoma-derived growth factor-related protein 2-like n=1 Tax=Eutrema salsugineum TaxID=72664 RepID=UPI000CED7BC9|nr:hepatoma-derived growth factor-related protein 2-like [Eutrema salsugineum]
MIPASITNYVGFVTLCTELDEIPTSWLFEDLFSVNIHKSKEWFFAANAKPRKNIVTGVKPSKYNDWESQYFFLEMKDLTVNNSDIPTQSEWKIPIGRHLPSILLNSGLTSEFKAAFSEAASVKEQKPPKPKSRANKPRAAPRRKAPKPQARRARTARMLSLDEIPTLFDEEKPNVADPAPIPVAEGTNEQPEELPPAANSPDQAGHKKLKRKRSSKKIKRIEGSSRTQDATAELDPPTAATSDLAIPQDQPEASNSRKRQDRGHAEDSPKPEPAKRTKVRVSELEEHISKAEERLATELQINDSLHTAVDFLKRESSELKAVRAELTEAQTLLSREFEKDKERLQGLVAHWKSRAKSVHAKACERLEKVIRSLDDANRARKPYLVVNQLTGVLGFIKQLKKKGLYEVPPEMVAEIEAKHAKALQDFRSVDACVLTEEDKRMSPFSEDDDDAPVGNVTQIVQDPARGEQFGSNDDILYADQAATSKTV